MELYQVYCLETSQYFKTEICERAKAFTEKSCCDTENKCNPVSLSCCGTQEFPNFKTIGFKCCPDCINYEIQKEPTHFSPNNLAVFTARGPTLDGRVKPDVVTVGDKILSSLSQGTDINFKCNQNQEAKDSLLQHEGFKNFFFFNLKFFKLKYFFRNINGSTCCTKCCSTC
jgi:hypothetical protein